MRNLKKRAISLFSAAAISVCSASQFTSVIAADNNPFNLQNNKEVPYDGTKWEQPSDWRDEKIDLNGYTGNEKVWFDKITITENEAKYMVKNRIPKIIDLNVSGAAGKVSTIGFHTYYDTRLTIKYIDEKNKEFAESGDAIKKDFTGMWSMISDGKYNFVVSSSGDNLKDGVIYSVDFYLPDNAKAGDLYPVGIQFWTDGTASDIFCNQSKDYEGKRMMTYMFTKGITNGYIKILPTGDVNGDERVTPVDASKILIEAANIAASPFDAMLRPTAYRKFDINGDGKVTAVDASLILAYCADLTDDPTLTFEAFIAKHNIK